MKHRKDGRATEPQPFAIFTSKQSGRVAVRIGDKRAYASVGEVSITAAGLIRVVCTKDGLVMTGEGVVRQIDQTIAITG